MQIRNSYWFFCSRLLLIVYAFLQLARWPILPYYMDIHYHLHTAWGFIQAGGYSGWDFWQFAPVGRVNIYPPFFHILLALLTKAGLNTVFLAKFFQAVTPVLFLLTVFCFIKKNYSQRLAFFVLITLSSSFSFYLSLINRTPATLAMIFGILAWDEFLRKRFLRTVLLLTLCFYTHIGVPWFFAISFILYGLLNKEFLKSNLIMVLLALILSFPVLWKELAAVAGMSFAAVNERFFCEFKILDYILALSGLILACRIGNKYNLFVSLMLASFIFLAYPYRFFSAEGYLAIIFLSAVCLDFLYEKIKVRNVVFRGFFAALSVFILFISPTIITAEAGGTLKMQPKVYFFDSALLDMIFVGNNPRVASRIVWFPEEFLSAAKIIKENSQGDDIIFSPLSNVSVCLGGLSGRASSNGLFPEIIPKQYFDPYSAAKIILAFKSDDPQLLQGVVDRYRLEKIGDNKIFIVYKNDSTSSKLNVRKASVPFTAILFILCLFGLLFCIKIM